MIIIVASSEVYIKAFSKGTPFTVRQVRASHIGQLVKISGIITRCSDVKPLMQVAVYTCEDCGFEIYQVLSFWMHVTCQFSNCHLSNLLGMCQTANSSFSFIKKYHSSIICLNTVTVIFIFHDFLFLKQRLQEYDNYCFLFVHKTIIC